MKTFSFTIGLLSILFGFISVFNGNLFYSVYLFSEGIFFLIVGQVLSNQEKMVNALEHLADPELFYATQYFPKMIEEYTDKNHPEFGNSSFSSRTPRRMQDGTFRSLVTINDTSARYLCSARCDGNAQDPSNWKVVEFTPSN